MLCRISISADCSRSERIDRILQRRFPQMRFESVAVDHVNGLFEEFSNILFDRYIAEDRDHGGRIELDENVDIAIRSVFTTRRRAEQRGMTYAAGAESALV